MVGLLNAYICLFVFLLMDTSSNAFAGFMQCATLDCKLCIGKLPLVFVNLDRSGVLGFQGASALSVP